MLWFKNSSRAREVEPRLRRICDITTLYGLSGGREMRARNRLTHAIPVLLCPVENGDPTLDQAIVVVARDISDDGVGVIVHQSFSAKDVILAFWLGEVQSAEPWFFRATVQRALPMGGGLSVLGIELAEFLNNGRRCEYAALLPAAEKLAPPIAPAESRGPRRGRPPRS